VLYSYDVGGRHYVNDRLSFSTGKGFRSAEEAEEELQSYQPQASFEVHYRADEPSKSALVIEQVGWDRYGGIVLCLLVLLFGIGALTDHFKQQRRVRRGGG
jgi:hypothetical protein